MFSKVSAVVAILAISMCAATAMAKPPKPFRNTPFDRTTWPGGSNRDSGSTNFPMPQEPSKNPAEWTRWVYDGGYFKQNLNGTWSEYQNERLVYNFTVMGRNRDGVYLYDSTRKMQVALLIGNFQIKPFNQQSFRFLKYGNGYR